MATVGIISNAIHFFLRLKKAGKAKNLGFCSVVRGVAKNAVDHPHGGGRGKSSIGKKPMSL
jgi:large subunit ribosomal protein L2